LTCGTVTDVWVMNLNVGNPSNTSHDPLQFLKGGGQISVRTLTLTSH
jgi:hypothetical protein